MRHANYWISSFLFTMQHTFRTCCYLTLKENGTDVVLFTVPQFPTPWGCATRGTGDLLILIVNENEKWQHTEPFRLTRNMEKRVWWKMPHRIVGFINGYVVKVISNFSLPKLHLFPMLALPYMLCRGKSEWVSVARGQCTLEPGLAVDG